MLEVVERIVGGMGREEAEEAEEEEEEVIRGREGRSEKFVDEVEGGGNSTAEGPPF